MERSMWKIALNSSITIVLPCAGYNNVRYPKSILALNEKVHDDFPRIEQWDEELNKTESFARNIISIQEFSNCTSTLSLFPLSPEL